MSEATRLTDAVRALAASAYTAYLVAYFAVPVARFGRTPGQALLGLRVRCSDGRPVGAVRAVVRALVLPLLTTATLGLSALGILLGRRRRALHDVIAGTVVVYDAPEPARALLHVEHR